jgi:alcohol dehydrogenase (cytochrome c)
MIIILLASYTIIDFIPFVHSYSQEDNMPTKAFLELWGWPSEIGGNTYKLLPQSTNTTFGTEPENKDNWITANHDIAGTRNSNQTTIGKENVDRLQVKWILQNDRPIEDPPLIIRDRGYVQDNKGDIIAFDVNTGQILWKIGTGGGGGLMHGMTYDQEVIFAGTGLNATTVAVNATDGEILWESPVLGPSLAGYKIGTPPIIWNDYVVVGSAGGDVPEGPGIVRGNITAVNRTNGEIIWNFDTTTGDWVREGKNPPNGGANAWSGGSFDPETNMLYMSLGNPSPNFNASTRLTPNLYANHMAALNITNGKLVWATPFIAEGTVLNVRLPDTHDWDASWGSSISKLKFDNGTVTKVVVGHDKMGNIIAMDAATGAELWWRTMGTPIRTDTIPQPNGSGVVWTDGIHSYHAIEGYTLYFSTSTRGLNYFTDGVGGHKIAPPDTIREGHKNGTITAVDMRTGDVLWQYQTEFPAMNHLYRKQTIQRRQDQE